MTLTESLVRTKFKFIGYYLFIKHTEFHECLGFGWADQNRSAAILKTLTQVIELKGMQRVAQAIRVIKH